MIQGEVGWGVAFLVHSLVMDEVCSDGGDRVRLLLHIYSEQNRQVELEVAKTVGSSSRHEAAEPRETPLPLPHQWIGCQVQQTAVIYTQGEEP